MKTSIHNLKQREHNAITVKKSTEQFIEIQQEDILKNERLKSGIMCRHHGK
jgi:hypothetical protein